MINGNIAGSTTKVTVTKSFIRTDTTRFVVPQIFNREDVITNNFLNAYTNCLRYPEEEYIILTYNKPNENLYKYNPEIVEISENLIIYYFKIPTGLNIFIDKFMKGKYSTFFTTEKQKILSFWDVTKHSKLHNILYPKDYFYEVGLHQTLLYKIGEVWPKPDITKETYKHN